MQVLKTNPGLCIPYLMMVIVYLSFFLFSTHPMTVIAAIGGILFTLVIFLCHIVAHPILVILATVAMMAWLGVMPRVFGV